MGKWLRLPNTILSLNYPGQNSSSVNEFPNCDGWVEQAFGGRGSISRIWLLECWWQWARGGVGPSKPPDVNELGQWSGQWRPPEPALVAATRARTMRRRRIRQQLRPPPPLSSSLLHLSCCCLAFPAPACLLCTGAAPALHRAARLLAAAAGLNPLSLSLAVGRRTCHD